MYNIVTYHSKPLDFSSKISSCLGTFDGIFLLQNRHSDPLTKLKSQKQSNRFLVLPI